MRKIQTKDKYDHDISSFNELAGSIELITKQMDAYSQARGGVNSGNKFEADYFAVQNIIDYVKRFESDMKQMIKIYKETYKLVNRQSRC